MPTSPLSLCTVPGCPEKVPSGKCTKHRLEAGREADKRRGNGYQRGWSAEWAAYRKDYLTMYPWCAVCGQRATDIDHIDGTGRRGARAYDPANLQALCASHHSQKTATQDGGFGRKKRNPDGAEWD